MVGSEKARAFISRVREPAAECQGKNVAIDDQEIAMIVLCALAQKYEHLIVAIDAVADDDILSLDFVKSRLLQDEPRIVHRGDIKPIYRFAREEERSKKVEKFSSFRRY